MEGNTIKFDVIIPTYNRADCILDTINSVLEQTYPAKNIIVVDNCSTDNTRKILGPLIQGGQIEYIRHPVNLERSASRNTGLKHATGDFVSFLDSDDFLYPDYFEDAVEFIKNNPDTKVFHCKYELINKEKRPIYQYDFPSLENQFKALASGNFMSNIGGFLHKDVYTQIQFDTDSRMIGSEDYLIWFSIFSRYQIGRIDKVNCGVLEHENRSVNTGIYKNLGYQKDKIVSSIKADPVISSKFGIYLKRLEAAFLLQMALSQGKNSKTSALRYLWKSSAADPTVILTKRFLKVIYNIILR